MPRALTLLWLFLSTQISYSQKAVGVWSDHLEYDLSYDIAVADDLVFSSNGSSLLIYDKIFDETRKLSKVNGLSDIGITSIGWSPEQHTLIIAYNNGNIDLLKENRIINISDILKKNIDAPKIINKIRCYDDFAYMASDFGIVVLDIAREEVKDTWRPATNGSYNAVNDLAMGGGEVFAATDNGVYKATLGVEGLSFFGNWELVDVLPTPTAVYNVALFSGNKLYFNMKVDDGGGDKLYVVDGNSASLCHNETGFNIIAADISSDGFIASGKTKLLSFNSLGELTDTYFSYPWGEMSVLRAIWDNGDIWIADNLVGLVKRESNGNYLYYILPGPAFNNAANIFSDYGVTVMTGGGITSSWGNLGNEAAISVNSGYHWTVSSSNEHFDAMRAVVDPTDKSRIIVSTYGTGLLEYKLQGEELALVRDYRAKNSPIEAITTGDTERVTGVAFDPEGNLWMVQPQVQANIKVLKPDGNWIIFPNDIEGSRIGDIIVSSKGDKWILIPGKGFYVLDDNSTPENFNDDRFVNLTVTDQNGATFKNVFSVAEDLDGAIWVGTDQGPMVYYNPGRVFDSNITVNRPKIRRNDGTELADYLLGTETITSIAIDGGNRKWFGTEASGAYLIDEDGQTLIRNYNENNSPLFSNQINSLAVDGNTGEVWFATAEGVLSVRGDATEGREGFKNVYAFPNPVREDFFGNLTITGLDRDTQIRITDISGNLVYRTVSDGGQASWDLKGHNGRRVATGVYLIFCMESDGKDSTVIKILVIN